MATASHTSSVLDPNSVIAEPAQLSNLPFYESLQWEPLESPVETCAPEKLRLNAPDQPNLWAYLEQDSETSSSTEIHSTIEIYDDGHDNNPCSSDDFRDLQLLAPYKWICPGTGTLSDSVHALKGYLLACFIVRGHTNTWIATCDQNLYRVLDHAVALIEKGQHTEHEFAVGETTSTHKDPNLLLPPASPPQSPISSASDTSEPDRESLERALCLKFNTSTLSFMSTLRWVSNSDVPIGKRLRVGSRDGQPIFADFTPEAIATVQVLIRQGEKLRAAKTVRKGDLDKVKWDVPFSYVVDDIGALGDGEELRNFFKGLFVLEGLSCGAPVAVDEEAFCGAVNRIIHHTGDQDAVDGTNSANSTSLQKPKTRNTASRLSDVMTRQESSQLDHNPNLSSGHAQDYNANKIQETRPVQHLRLASTGTNELETNKATEGENGAKSSNGLDENVESFEDTTVEGRALIYEGIIERGYATSLNQTRDLPAPHTHTTDALQFKMRYRRRLQEEVQLQHEKSRDLDAIIKRLYGERVRRQEQRAATLALKLKKEEELVRCDDEISALKRQRGEEEGETGNELYRALEGEAGPSGGAKRQK